MEASKLGSPDDEDEEDDEVDKVEDEVEGGEGDVELSRKVFERGYKDLKSKGEKEDVSRCRDLPLRTI